jgi:hypothetical protein
VVTRNPSPERWYAIVAVRWQDTVANVTIQSSLGGARTGYVIGLPAVKTVNLILILAFGDNKSQHGAIFHKVPGTWRGVWREYGAWPL